MAEYKRKKIKHKRVKNKALPDDLILEEKKEKKQKKTENKKPLFKNKTEKPNITEEENFDFSDDNEFRVVKGRKTEKRKKLITVTVSLFLALAIIVSAFAFMPVNIIDSFGYTVASLGGGEYPIEYSRSIIEDCVQQGSYYYVLTDTALLCFTKNGKEIFSYSHGFSSPVLTVSSTRALVYNQGDTQVLIFNSKGLAKSFDTKEKIITAAIGMNGAYAVVTDSMEYASSVTVYSKNGKQLYLWNSAKDIINNVCISPFSKKIAVSCLNASGGEFVSKLFVFDFKSADPKFSLDFEDSVIYGLRSAFGGFAAVNTEKYSYFDWDNYERKDIASADRNVDTYKCCGDKTIVVFNRENDKTDNECKLVSSSGKINFDIKFSGVISDITYNGDKIYIVSDTNVFVYGKDSQLLKTGTCPYGADKIAAVSSDTLALISSDGIRLTEF